MKTLVLFFLLISTSYGGEVLRAPKPNDKEIFIIKKRVLYIAVDKDNMGTLESAFSKKWMDRVNKDVLTEDNYEIIKNKMDEYDSRVERIRKSFDIIFVDWYNTGLLRPNGFRVGRYDKWESFPEGEFESYLWLDFMEWFVYEWNFRDNQLRSIKINEIDQAVYDTSEYFRKLDFVFELVFNNPDRFQRIFDYELDYYHSEIDEGSSSLVWDTKLEKNIPIIELGYKPGIKPYICPVLKHKICPLDKKYKLSGE